VSTAVVVERGRELAAVTAEPEYETADQLAARLQCSPKTLYRWAATDPTMPVLRIGGVVRFPRARMTVWLRGKEQGMGRPRRATGVTNLNAPGEGAR
jgi:helix-turn-helix protein